MYDLAAQADEENLYGQQQQPADKGRRMDVQDKRRAVIGMPLQPGVKPISTPNQLKAIKMRKALRSQGC